MQTVSIECRWSLREAGAVFGRDPSQVLRDLRRLGLDVPGERRYVGVAAMRRLADRYGFRLEIRVPA